MSLWESQNSWKIIWKPLLPDVGVFFSLGVSSSHQLHLDQSMSNAATQNYCQRGFEGAGVNTAHPI